MTIITYQAVENKIITLRNLQVITQKIHQAASWNPEKFPNGNAFCSV